MATAATQQRYETVITGIETVDKDGHPIKKPILVTTIIPELSKFPGRYALDGAMLKGFKPGDRVVLVMQRGNQRQGTDGSQAFHYYHDISAVLKAGEAMPDAALPATASANPSAPPAAPQAQRDAKPDPRQPGLPLVPLDRDPGMNRRTALMQAVQLAATHAASPGGKVLAAKDVLAVAEAFNAWLNGASMAQRGDNPGEGAQS